MNKSKKKSFGAVPKFRKHRVLKAQMGGGPSGRIGFAPYVEDVHSKMLGTGGGLYSGTTLSAIMKAMIDGAISPYEGEIAYNPDGEITANQSRYNTYNAGVIGLNHQTDWQAVIGTARAKLDETATYPKIDLVSNDIAANAIANSIALATSIIAGSAISDQVTAYENKVVPRFLRSVNRFASGLADIGAVNSSAFIIGMALLESEVNADVNKYNADLSGQVFNAVAVEGTKIVLQTAATQRQHRNVQLAEASALMMEALNRKISSGAHATAIQLAINQEKTKSKLQQNLRQLELDVLDSQWDLEVMSKGGQILGAPGSGTYIPNKPSTGELIASTVVSGIGAFLQLFGA
jgi:hypothetical protein